MNNNQPRPMPDQIFNAVRAGTIDDFRDAIKTWNWRPDEEDDKGFTLFFYAIFHGRFDLADFLLEAGASVDCPDREGWTPLFWAAHNQHEQVVRYLISRGANPNVRNIDGEWPLFWAVCRNDWEIVSLLLLGGANLNWTDADGHDVFWLAQALGLDDMLVRLRGLRDGPA